MDSASKKCLERNQLNGVIYTTLLIESHGFSNQQKEKNGHGRAQVMGAKTRSITSLSAKDLEIRFFQQIPILESSCCGGC